MGSSYWHLVRPVNLTFALTLYDDLRKAFIWCLQDFKIPMNLQKWLSIAHTMSIPKTYFFVFNFF
ncbi:hypothetical protein BZZ01_01710 [Nostocales cyanobacterium HT-58-2]|nr:hypothetical protein BZZ01_01710 [Nostocales cyanobacterium HT-58-2]